MWISSVKCITVEENYSCKSILLIVRMVQGKVIKPTKKFSPNTFQEKREESKTELYIKWANVAVRYQ